MICPDCKRDFPEEMLDENSKQCKICLPTKEVNDQSQEMICAETEKRNPFCQGCEHEIFEITQTQHEYIYWKWNEESKCFIKVKDDYNGDAEKPKHICHVNGCHCESEFSSDEFLDDNSGSSIGVDY